MQPVTHQAIVDKIMSLFGGKTTQRGEFFLPNVEFYNSLTDDTALVSATKDICRWLGFKPYRLHVNFVKDTVITNKDDHIQIPDYYVDFPYQTGALLALGVIRYLVRTRLDYPEADDEFIEIATIEQGLGILVLNGLHPKRSKLLEIHHGLSLNWHVKQDVELVSYRPKDYAGDVMRFALDYRLNAENWASYLSPEALRLLPFKGITHRKQHALPNKELQHRQSAKLWWSHLILLAFLLGFITATFVYVWGQRPKHLPIEATNAYENSQTLEKAHSICVSTAKEEKDNTNQSDFYAQQRLNVTLERCTSLRNQYNYQVDTYNRIVSEY